MSNPNPPEVKPEFFLIDDLLNWIHGGRIRIPEFQRPFVWKPEDIFKLFESIDRFYPIGSLLFWETDQTVSSTGCIGPLEVPKSNEPGKYMYVLDGQQRLSTLYGALRLPADFGRDAKGQQWKWWLYYDLEECVFKHVPNGQPKPECFPVRALLRTKDFKRETARLYEHFGEEAADRLIERAESLTQRLRSYKMTAMIIRGGDLDDAAEIFSRLNTAGQKISKDQMLSALTHKEGEEAFDLARSLDRIADHLREYDMWNLRRLVLMRAFVAAQAPKTTAEHSDVDVYKAEWGSFRNRDAAELTKTAEEVEEALVRAVKLVRYDVGVPSDRLFPYMSQLIPLSVFFRVCPEPTPAQKALLCRWFWATSFSGWFASVNSTNMRKIVAELRALGEGKVHELRVASLDDPARPFPDRFDLRSARLRTLVLVMMLKLKPQGLDCQPLDPAKLIHERGHRAFSYVFRERTAQEDITSAPANRVFLDLRPRESPRTALLKLPDELRDRVLASHGISPSAFDALRADDSAAFVKARTRTLLEMERAFMVEHEIRLPEAETGATDFDTDDDSNDDD